MLSFADNPEDFHLPILGPLNGTLETDLEAYNRFWEALRYLAAGFYKSNWKNRFSTHGLDLSIDKLPAEFSASAEEREALREAEQKAHHDAEVEMQPKAGYMFSPQTVLGLILHRKLLANLLLVLKSVWNVLAMVSFRFHLKVIILFLFPPGIHQKFNSLGSTTSPFVLV